MDASWMCINATGSGSSSHKDSPRYRLPHWQEKIPLFVFSEGAWKCQQELARQQALLQDELNLLSVHKDIKVNPEVWDDLYGEEDRNEDVDHHPSLARRPTSSTWKLIS